SDVCSSDLADEVIVQGPLAQRDYSRVFRVHCSRLPSTSVMKLCLKPHSLVQNPRDARGQFSILEKVHTASSDKGMRLAPQPYLLMESEGVFLAEWITGDIMARRLFGLHPWLRLANRMDLDGAAAKWLRSFHQLNPLPSGTLELQSKVF